MKLSIWDIFLHKQLFVKSLGDQLEKSLSVYQARYNLYKQMSAKPQYKTIKITINN